MSLLKYWDSIYPIWTWCNTNNYNLCVGLQAGIEATVHAVEDKMQPDQGEPHPTMDSAPVPPPTPGKMEPDLANPDGPTRTLLVDARNGFNELSHKAMLWTVRVRWPNRAWFAFNCYQQFFQAYLNFKIGGLLGNQQVQEIVT